MKIPHQLINGAKEKIDSLVVLGLNNRNNRLTSAVMASLVPVLIWFLIHYKFPSRGRYAMVYHENISWWKLVFIITISITILSIAFYSLLKLAKRNVIYTQRNKHNKRYSTLLIQPIRQLSLLVIIPFTIILSLLLIDLIAMMLIVSPKVLYGGDYDFLPKLYFGAFAILGFGVSAYVAFVRHQSLKNSEKQFDHAQKQFEYTQQQDLEEEIEKRFQEGIKLLGNDNESVRIGGIYILWEIVKDAVKALPYLKEKNLYTFYFEAANGQLYPYIRDISRMVNIHIENDSSEWYLNYVKDYITTIKELASSEEQKSLKNKYITKNNVSFPEVRAFKKAHSLSSKILHILCGHIRTLSNSRDYLLKNHPSVAKQDFLNEHINVYQKDSGFIPDNEKPTDEIQVILDLFFKDNKLPHNSIPCCIATYALNFDLNLSSTILIGANFEEARFFNVNFHNTMLCNCNFTKSTFERVRLTKADVRNSLFDDVRAYDCNFNTTNFKHSSFNKTKFTQVNCMNSNFSHAKFKMDILFEDVDFGSANFSYTEFSIRNKFYKTDLSFANFHRIVTTNLVLNDCSFYLCTFSAINASLGKKSNWCNIEIDGNANIQQLLKKMHGAKIIRDPWRISIADINKILNYHVRLVLPDNFSSYLDQKDDELIGFLSEIQIRSGKYKEPEKIFKSLTISEKNLAQKYFTDFDDFPIEENNDNSKLES